MSLHKRDDKRAVYHRTICCSGDYRDYRTTELFLETLPSVITIRPQKKSVAKVTLIRLYVRSLHLNYALPPNILPAHPIIEQHLHEIYPKARLPPYEEKTPRYLLHVDPFLNIIQAHDEDVGTYFCGYRRLDIRLDPRIRFKDGSEYYVTELFDAATLRDTERRRYDEEALKLIVPYLKRGYYLPHLLQLEMDITRRQRYQQLTTEEEEWHRFYYPDDEGPYLECWKKLHSTLNAKEDAWPFVLDAYKKGIYIDPEFIL